ESVCQPPLPLVDFPLAFNWSRRQDKTDGYVPWRANTRPGNHGLIAFLTLLEVSSSRFAVHGSQLAVCS
ncbi:MAG TPA: hypothetical protein VK673_18080, partial [Chthoniobacterales bacterium]|nr:hypothetical protein [Chthoniobacterales bacterium]